MRNDRPNAQNRGHHSVIQPRAKRGTSEAREGQESTEEWVRSKKIFALSASLREIFSRKGAEGAKWFLHSLEHFKS